MLGNLLSPSHLLLILLIVLILFGRGKISELMGDFGRGISSFKKGLAEEENSGENLHKPAKQTEENAASPEEKARRQDLR